MTVLYACSMEHKRGALLVELRCETCDDVHRVMFDDEALNEIACAAELAAGSAPRALIRSSVLAAWMTAPAMMRFAVWILTHTTAHLETQRRDAAKGT